MKLSKYEKELRKLMRQCGRGSYTVAAAAKAAKVDLLSLWAIAANKEAYAVALEACKKRCADSKKSDDELDGYFAEGMFRLDYDLSGKYLECEH